MDHVIWDVLGYLVAAGLFAYGGRGLLRLTRVPIDSDAALLLGPCAIHALWACLLGLIVMGRWPVRWFAAPLWGLTIGLAIFGVYRERRAREAPPSTNVETRASRMLFGLCLVLPVLVLLPMFVFGLADYRLSGYLDGWAYTAYGQYLWQFRRGSEGGLAPLYQWASHLSGTRHIASAQLGPLSYLMSPGDLQSAAGLLQALALFTITSTCAAFARLRRLPFETTVIYLLVAAGTGWLLNVCWAQNFDNLLAIVYFPALAALMSDGRVVESRSTWMVAGLLLAGLIYTYPELTPIVLICLVPIVAQRMWQTRRWSSLAGPLLAIAICAVVSAPYLPDALFFLRQQLSTGLVTGGPRPGDGYFLGLNDPAHRIAGLWALGGEHQVVAWRSWTTGAAVLLFVLLAAGIVRLLRQRDLGLPVTVIVIGAATSVFLFQKAYPYGAYKFIVMGWWALAFVVVSGADWLRHLPGPARGPLAAVGLLLCLIVPFTTSLRAVELVREGPGLTMAHYRASAKAVALAGNGPIAVVVKDLLARHWAVYFLRDANIRVLYLDGYLGMPHVRALLDRSSPPSWEGTRFMLTDAAARSDAWTDHQAWTLVWGAGAYGLWDTRDQGWAIVTHAATPNGFETTQGRAFFWIGGGRTELTLLADRAGTLEFSARFGCGPRLGANVSTCRLLVDAPAGTKQIETVGDGDRTLTMALRPGENKLGLAAADEGTVSPPAQGDPRPLMVGVFDPRLRFVP